MSYGTSGCKRRQSLVMILRPAVFECDVPSLDVARFHQALPNCSHPVRHRIVPTPAPRSPMTGIAGCCARAG